MYLAHECIQKAKLLHFRRITVFILGIPFLELLQCVLLHSILGGTITGKANCEFLCFSGCSWTNSTGPTLNPHDVTRSAGGSSSGSAALVIFIMGQWFLLTRNFSF